MDVRQWETEEEDDDVGAGEIEADSEVWDETEGVVRGWAGINSSGKVEDTWRRWEEMNVVRRGGDVTEGAGEGRDGEVWEGGRRPRRVITGLRGKGERKGGAGRNWSYKHDL